MIALQAPPVPGTVLVVTMLRYHLLSLYGRRAVVLVSVMIFTESISRDVDLFVVTSKTPLTVQNVDFWSKNVFLKLQK